MIFVRVSGRLGNQMFQYAFARGLQENRPDLGQIILVPGTIYSDKYGGLAIMDFAVKTEGIRKKTELTKKQTLIWWMFRIYKGIGYRIKGDAFARTTTIRFQPFLNKNGIYYYGKYDDVRVHYNANSKNVLVWGFWENPVYFENIKHILKREFTPLFKSLPQNTNVLNRIKTTNSVCVSVRRGDFLSEKNKGRYNVCTKNYFYEAEKKMAEMLESYQLFIFSDDIEWCRKELHFKGPVYYENNNGNDPAWEKIRLMTSCKHFIISNSTFSWWVQYLSDYPEKIVVAPRPWRNNEYHDCLYDESFILLDGANGLSSR